MLDTFKALVVRENEDGNFARKIENKKFTDLPDNDVLVRVHYSALNFKDALSATGHKGISRVYPHTPGVDAGGVVVKSENEKFKEGDEVVITGHDLGMNTSGGLAEYVSVPSEWVINLPDSLSLKEAMIYGTHGITASMCIYELQKQGITPESGKILVTGSTGGVGSMAVALLAKERYHVIAATGKMDKKDYLLGIGASEVINRSELHDESGKPLLRSRWIGAVDTVGGKTLSTVIAHTGQHGAVCCLGLVESDKFCTTLYPFLLRGLKLIGIDSAEKGIQLKRYLWNQLALEWKPKMLLEMAREVNLEDIDKEIDLILKGGQVGKVLVKCKAG